MWISHALLHESPTGEERRDVLTLHARLAVSHPPLGAELDGYYLLLADARRLPPPKDQVRPGVVDESWALHCAHLRAGRSIVLLGPDPKDIVPAPSWNDLAAALRGELDYVTNPSTASRTTASSTCAAWRTASKRGTSSNRKSGQLPGRARPCRTGKP